MKYYHVVTILTIIASLTALNASAQYDVSFAHYFDKPTAYNPAAAGRDTKLNVNVGYAMSLIGFENSPQTAYISADMPFHALNMRHGVGLKFLNDKLGLFTHQSIAAQYVYRRKLAGGNLGIGIQAALLSESFDGANADMEESGDDVIPTSQVDGNGLDLAAGIYYDNGPWYAGVSVQHANSPLVTLGERNEIKVNPTLYLTGGYLFRLRNPFLSIATSTLLRTDFTAYRADITARLIYNNEGKRLSAGVGYSPDNSATIYIGGSFHGIILGYSYEIYTSGLNIGDGAHEISVTYQTDINFFPKGRNRHQAVRYL